MIAFFVGLGAFGYDLLVGFPRPHNPRVFGVPEKTERAPVGAREKLGIPDGKKLSRKAGWRCTQLGFGVRRALFVRCRGQADHGSLGAGSALAYRPGYPA